MEATGSDFRGNRLWSRQFARGDPARGAGRAFLSGIFIRNVRSRSRADPERASPVLSSLALWGRKGTRPLADDKLSREFRNARVKQHLFNHARLSRKRRLYIRSIGIIPRIMIGVFAGRPCDQNRLAHWRTSRDFIREEQESVPSFLCANSLDE
jgi:hypothetical protein